LRLSGNGHFSNTLIWLPVSKSFPSLRAAEAQKAAILGWLIAAAM